MAPELSSNWKKLRATLQANPSSTPNLKRKRTALPPSTSEVVKRNSIAKRRRLEETKPKPKPDTNSIFSAATRSSASIRKRMGNGASTQGVQLEENGEEEGETKKRESQDLLTWAEENDISPSDLIAAYGTSNPRTSDSKTIPIASTAHDRLNAGLLPGTSIGKYVAIDCEMVGVGGSGSAERSVVARASVVNFHGQQIYDSYVRVAEFVTDWRTAVSGIRPQSMVHARPFEEVQTAIAEILRGRVLVGHAVHHDLAVLGLEHPKRDIRDTSRYSGFRRLSAGRVPGLRRLVGEVLGVEIQSGEHSSVVDARATMALFRLRKREMEEEVGRRFGGSGMGNAGGGGGGKGGKGRRKKGKKG
ncbi:hypothetical protein B7494_g2894 [Chlorociboria aeruginascens]|nr:hypothetical protein B7494_g2894 [Chlorociboria aeruginascens]